MSKEAVVVDLRSNTVTKPTEEMKSAMITAAVGDDVFGEDPTVNSLEAKVAGLLGKESALFVPSGTMANLIAAMVHCYKRGSKMLCGDQSHVYKREGGIADLAGVHVTGLKNHENGTFGLEEFTKHIRDIDIHEPITMMVSIENTHSYCGGKVIPLEWIEELASIANHYCVTVHMDGARLWNASKKLQVEPARVARDCDSVSVCFSKGLGAPVGSALAGTRKFIDQARRYRKMLGGGMRQVGVLAAAAIVALDETLPSLHDDHRKAFYLAKEICNLNLPHFTVDLENIHTNIVHVKISDEVDVTSKFIIKKLAVVSESEDALCCRTSEGLGIIVLGSAKPDPKTVKFVLHQDVNDDNLKLAVQKIKFIFTYIEDMLAMDSCRSDL